MARYRNEENYRHGSQSHVGVLLVNLGTPDAPTRSAVRRYLKEFLLDTRVVEISPLLWRPFLNFLVLPLRSRRKARAYASIWTEQGSPLLVNSMRLMRSFGGSLRRVKWPGAVVELGMTYGRPSIAAAFERLQEQGARRVVVLPLFPQYSGTTTAAVFDAVARALRHRRRLPEIRFINDYHDDPAYIEACAQRIRAYRREHGAGQMLLLSFHGLPKRNLVKGDPYNCQCHATARLIAGKLGLPGSDCMVSFQSRFGRADWLEPHTDETLRQLAEREVHKVDVFCPGFAVDCLETLEEIAVENRLLFEHAGGVQMNYIPALNDMPDHAEGLAELVATHMQGWEAWTSGGDPEELEQSRARALKSGAEN